jgi:hypothetical protein
MICCSRYIIIFICRAVLIDSYFNLELSQGEMAKIGECQVLSPVTTMKRTSERKPLKDYNVASCISGTTVYKVQLEIQLSFPTILY